MLLKMLFAIFYVVYFAFLPVLFIYIDDQTGYITGPDAYSLLFLLRVLVLLLPGVALVKAYKVYKDCNRKN